MKQIVRLTETQLHNIIKESVMRILKEEPSGLDWKTYANAAYKSNRRYFDGGQKNDRDLQRVKKFSDAAVQAFKDKYPEATSQEDRKFEPYANGYGMGYKAEHSYPTIDGRHSTIKADRTSNNMSDRVNYANYDKDGNIDFQEINSDMDYPYNDLEKDAVKDVDMYSRLGTSRYKHGKGWQ